MPPGGPPPREAVIAEALEVIRTEGLDGLTARRLADRLDTNHAAVLRAVGTMDDLLTGALDAFLVSLTTIALPDGSPRERVEALARGIRTGFLASPSLVALLAAATGEERGGLALSALGLDLLSEMGLEGRNLVLGFQMLESVIVGAQLFELLGTPDHLSVRRGRYRLIDRPALDEAAADIDAVAKLNDEGFEMLLGAVLDACERLAGVDGNPAT